MLPAQLDPMLHAAAGGKPPLLIKLSVIGQIGFRNQPQNLSFIDGKGNIIYGRDPCFIPLEFSAEIFYFQ